VRRTSSLCSHCQTQACRQRMLFCFSEQCVDLFQLACPAGLQRTRLSALSVNLHTPAESYGVSRYKQWKAIMHQWHAITHPDTFEHLAQLALPDLRRHDNLFMYSGDHKIHTRPYSPSSPCAACSVGSQMARQGPVSSSPCTCSMGSDLTTLIAALFCRRLHRIRIVPAQIMRVNMSLDLDKA